MNKIVIEDELVDVNVSEKIKVDIQEGFIEKINIDINCNCTIKINYNCTEKKFAVNYNTNNYKVKIIETKFNKSKILSTYNLGDSSELILIKVNDCLEIRQNDIVNLNGEYSNITYILKTVANGLEKYNLDVHHKSNNTVSNIINHGLNNRGNINFNVSSFIPNGYKNCKTNQDNRIINLVNKKCVIRPNLFIDEFEVEANHSALVGNFNEDEIFYLQRLGIDIVSAKKLLTQGFIKSYVEDKCVEIFKKYWR